MIMVKLIHKVRTKPTLYTYAYLLCETDLLDT
jgi:hypothetical protein